MGLGTKLFLFVSFSSLGFGQPDWQQTAPKEPIQSNTSLIVTLPGYGTFSGTKILTSLRRTTNFSSPIDAWLGVEYSTQPVGDNRFKSVELPNSFEGIKDASSFPPACFQDLYGPLQQSEACLTINVYRPSGIPMDQKLPVFVWLHGGSFTTGSHRNFDGALFVSKSVQPLMVITAQYRIGVLGTLPAQFMQEDGLLNLGLRDQKTMLEFLQKYLAAFGGDAERITLGGQSAGGHAVGLHLFHNYNGDEGKPLFSQIILSSGSPTARAFPGVDFALYQQQVRDFMKYVNCPMSPSEEALRCLRGADINNIQFVSTSMTSASNPNITWAWQPVSPGPLAEKRGSQSGEDGTFFKLPTLITSTTNEGTAFTSQQLQTNSDYIQFWRTLTPGMSAQDISDVQTLYPEAAYASNSSVNFVSPLFKRLAAAYGDYAYACPVQDTASRLSLAGAPVYKARFNTPALSPTYLGVPHAADSRYFNGEKEVPSPEIAEIYSAYWASFIVSGDPNTYARTGSAVWDKYDVADGKEGMELAVNMPSMGGPQMEGESNGIRVEQCRWWRDQERAKRLNK